MRKFFIIIVAMFWAYPEKLSGSEGVRPLVVAGMKLPSIFDDEAPGPYNRIYDELVKGFDGSVDLKFQPYRRANLSFFTHQADCLFIGANKKKPYIDNGVPENLLLISEVVDHIRLKVYTRSDEPLVTEISQLEGESVAFDITAGVLDDRYRNYIENNIELLPTTSLEQALAMLDQKRVRAAFVYDVDIDIREIQLGKTLPYSADPGLTLKYDQDAFVCWKDDRTEEFVAHLNKRIKLLRKTGWIQDIIKGIKH